MRPLFLAATLSALAPPAAALQLELPLTTRLVSPNAAGGDSLGWSLDVSGNTLVAGALGADSTAPNGPPNAGAAVVFVRTGGQWAAQGRLEAVDAGAGRRFADTIAIDGDVVVVGAPLDDDLGARSGSVYVFVRQGATWSQQAKLTAADGAANDTFGTAVAIAGDSLAVGSPRNTNAAGVAAGAVYVFARAGTSWSQQAKLVGAELQPASFLGNSVTIEGDTLVAGTNTNVDEAYVFVRSGTQWGQQARLTPSRSEGESFGASVSLFGDTLAVGALPSGLAPGAVYVFARQGNAWTQEDRLVLFFDGLNDLGRLVSIQGDTLVVSNQFESIGTPNGGAVRVYKRLGTQWVERGLMVTDPNQTNLLLGRSIALGADSIFGGAPTDDIAGLDAGAVFVSPLPFLSFCDDSDDALTACPCGAGTLDSGCDIEQATGGVTLDVFARETLPRNRMTLQGDGFPASAASAAFVVRAPALDPIGPSVFGDGLRCISSSLVRMGATISSAGTTRHTVGHSAMAGAGEFYYQIWFRNTPLSFCDPSVAFSLSNGRAVAW